MSGSSSQFVAGAIKGFSSKVPDAIIYSADFNEATDEIEGIEGVLGTGLRTRTATSFDPTASVWGTLTSRLNNIDAGVRSTNPTVHTQYALVSGTLSQPAIDGVVALQVTAYPGGTSNIVNVTGTAGESVLTISPAEVTFGKQTTLNAPTFINSGSVPALTLTTDAGYVGDVLRVKHGATTVFAISSSGTLSTTNLSVNSSPNITDFTNMQHDHSSPAQGGQATPPGVIVAFGGTSAPAGWLLCDGTAVSRATFYALFSSIGTVYGAGNGTQTFNVPDLRGRTALGASVGFAAGSSGGTVSHTLTTDQMPGHWHSIDHTHGGGTTADNTATHTHTAHAADGKWFMEGQNTAGYGLNNTATSSGAYFYFFNSIARPTLQTGNQTANHSHTFTTPTFTGPSGTFGSSASVNHLPPYQVVNFIIKT